MVFIHHPDAGHLALMLQPLVFANTIDLNRPLADSPPNTPPMRPSKPF